MFKIFDVIKYEGDNSTFVWKHPCEDFNSHSQLVVHESQEAVFFMNGQALDLFGPGRYTLKTQNLPILNNVINMPTGGVSPFHCEVYFINKTEEMAVKWGTDSRVQFIEPTYNFPLSIGASGEMSLRADDSRKLLIKLVGMEGELTQQRLVSFFRSFLMTRAKTYLAKIIRTQQLSIFKIDEKLTMLSDSIKELLIPDFTEYGISLEQFFVTKVAKPDGEEQYEKFKELHFRQYADITEAQIRQQTTVIDAETEAKQTVIDSQSQATKRQQEGYSYQQERGFDVAEKVASNEAVGEFTNMGVGLGAMAGVGGAVGGTVGGMMNDAMGTVMNSDPPIEKSDQTELQPTDGFCMNCGAKLSKGAAFCEECGTSVAPKNCSSCGYAFKGTEKFCPKCGTKREGQI